MCTKVLTKYRKFIAQHICASRHEMGGQQSKDASGIWRRRCEQYVTVFRSRHELITYEQPCISQDPQIE